LRVAALDVSGAALAVARQNILQHDLLERVYPLQLNLLKGLRPPLHKRFDLVCANLPYIPETALDGLDRLRWEPEIALQGGQAGIDLIQRLLTGIHQVIAPRGLLLMEIEASQGAAVTGLVQAALPDADIRLRADLAGHDRLVIVQT
ncbi:MAG: peptide chain release factor N(5)-glutamine methyltransferase, partial [Anaerolineales bacterium]